MSWTILPPNTRIMRCFANRTLPGVGRLVCHHERTRLTPMTINRAIVRDKDTKKNNQLLFFTKKYVTFFKKNIHMYSQNMHMLLRLPLKNTYIIGGMKEKSPIFA